MDPTQMLVKLSHLIQAISLVAEKVLFYGNNCHILAAFVKKLLPMLNEVQESNLHIIGEAITSFEGLEHVLLKAKDLLERCGGKSSRLYMVLRWQQFVHKFEALALEIDTYVSSLPLRALQSADKTQEQVEKCISEFREAMYDTGVEERLAKETEMLLKEIREGMRISHDKLSDLGLKFNLKSNQEILREASLLEKEKDRVRIDKDKHEEELLNQMIVLVTQMGDDLVERKQGEVECGGIPVPADFRCPLSLELMSDPVIVASGQTYERVSIQQWLDQGNTTCPKTRQILHHTNLIPNYTVKALIANWCEANDVSFPEPTKSNSLPMQSWSTPPLTATDSRPADSGQLQELLASFRIRDVLAAPISGNRTHERLGRSKPSSFLENHALDAGKDGHPLESGQGVGTFTQDVSRLVQCGDLNGRFLSTTSRSGDYNGDSLYPHSRHTSSSSLGSSADDVMSNAAFDENITAVTLGLNGFSAHDGDISGELQGFSVSSSCGSTSHEVHDSLATANINKFSASWRRREGGSDLNGLKISMPLNDGAGNGSENNSQASISWLVKELQSNSVDVQRNAATKLRFLAKHSVDNRILIANCDAIKPLVALLASTDSKTQENAVTALLNLSINDNNKNEIAAAGAIGPLVNLLKVGNSEAKENSAATLFSLSVMHENKIAIGQSGAIPPLVDLLTHGTLRGKKDAATALFNLSTYPENKSRVVGAGAVKPLVQLMTDPAAGMVDKAVAVLAILATITEGRCAIGEEGGIPALVEVVEMGSQRGKENAAAALLHLCTNSRRFHTMVLQEGAIPPLVALSQSGTARAKEKASSLLRHFREQRQALLGRGGVERHVDNRQFARPYG